jgi:hypothetical protein
MNGYADNCHCTVTAIASQVPVRAFSQSGSSAHAACLPADVGGLSGRPSRRVEPGQRFARRGLRAAGQALVENTAARGDQPRIILRSAGPTPCARRAQSLLPQGELVEVGVTLAEQICAAGEVPHVPLVDLFRLNGDGLVFACLEARRPYVQGLCVMPLQRLGDASA